VLIWERWKNMGKKCGISWKDMPKGENDWKNIPMLKMKNDAKIRER